MTSMAPGQTQTPHSLLTTDALTAASYLELAQTAAAILTEQHHRALADNDLGALLEEAFVIGFAGDGHPNIPWLTNGLLVCPGYIRNKSASSHDCTFASIDGTWSWDHPAKIIDNMRQLPGAKLARQSISILQIAEGMEIDVVSSAQKSGGACQMKKATSYQIRGGELVQVSTRARSAPKGHASS